ncbi:APC family permease [Pullulanibacillus sp. KACC 23026]|uniref:APC family permease n=1 Tax=Pullulanibacillus sp. KACC 23026 TaxID=3028315 RepID=UPI0023AF6CBC|nr:APC family permease [Pullulanibacillus sp. KACC 23026]WEG11122.1 APC family permease [Pullulanibacillus sp. KACC 23026]
MTLSRSLTLLPVVLFGIAYMSPLVVFGTYGVMVQSTHGRATSAYIVALVAMLFTAYSYGRMVKAYPTAGSAYTYARKSFGAHLGFMIGWAVLLDYFFLPMAACVVTASYLGSAVPGIPTWIWVVSLVAATTILNIIGIKITTSVNLWMMLFQLIMIAVFVVLTINGVVHGIGTGKLISGLPLFNPHGSFSTVMTGASIACYSFLGFDAISTLSEETIAPERTIPKATLLATLVCGLIFVIVTYVGQLFHPSDFSNVNAAGPEIVKFVGGNIFASVFVAASVVGSLTCGLSAQASVSRLLYAMGRDGVLPKPVFGKLHKKFKTPVWNILIVGVVCLAALKLNVATSTSFINFGAFTAFTFVNLSVIVRYFIRGRQRTLKDIALYVIMPLIGAGFTIWLFIHLDKNALRLGTAWAILGFIYLLFLTKMFRRKPPELDFAAADDVSESA